MQQLKSDPDGSGVMFWSHTFHNGDVQCSNRESAETPIYSREFKAWVNDQRTTKDTMSTVKIKKFEHTLRVQLTDTEIATRADRAAHLQAERDNKASDMKAAAQHAKAEISWIEATLRELLNEVRDRATYRPIECEDRFYFDKSIVVSVRTDTGEVISERPMHAHEKQLSLASDEESEDAPVLATTKRRGRPSRTQEPTEDE